MTVGSALGLNFLAPVTIPNLIRACGQRSALSARCRAALGPAAESGDSRTRPLPPHPPTTQARAPHPGALGRAPPRPAAGSPAPSALRPGGRDAPGPQTRARALPSSNPRPGRGPGEGSYLVQLLGGHGGRRGARRGAGPARRRAAGGPHFVPVGSLRGLRFLLRAAPGGRALTPAAAGRRPGRCAGAAAQRALRAALTPRRAGWGLGSSRRRGAGPGWGGRGGGARRRAGSAAPPLRGSAESFLLAAEKPAPATEHAQCGCPARPSRAPGFRAARAGGARRGGRRAGRRGERRAALGLGGQAGGQEGAGPEAGAGPRAGAGPARPRELISQVTPSQGLF